MLASPCRRARPPNETASLSFPVCSQKSICRGAALASRLDQLAVSGDKRGRSEAMLFAVLNGTSTTCDPTGHTDRVPPRQPQKTSFPLAAVSLHALQFYHCSIFFPNVWLMIFEILRTLTNLVTILQFCAVTRHQWRACVRRMLRCEFDCTVPLSSLDPKLASGAFAVVHVESRDRLIGDTRPLNRERSIGRAQVTYREGPNLKNHHFKKHLGVQIATDSNLVYTWFNCSTTTVSFCVSVVFLPCPNQARSNIHAGNPQAAGTA